LNTNITSTHLCALARPGQPLLKHLTGVGDFTALLYPSLESWARLIGLLHDYGKYRPDWVFGMLEIAQGRDPGKLPPHAREGALYLMRLFPDLEYGNVWVLALLIEAHHGGLPDISDGLERLTDALPEMDDAQWQIDPEYKTLLKEAITKCSYSALDSWILPNDYRTAQRLRFLFGSLVAADRQDAARSDGWKPKKHPTMSKLGEKLASWYAKKFGKPLERLDELRCDFYAECRNSAKLPPGWLSVRGPCGISKTWSVMQMALDHAEQWDKAKIIYCVPWTAILEQSYEQYKDKLGQENVLGHWSTLVDPDTLDPQQLRNSRQWWDTPIVATTMVQLFDVLLGSRARTAQRMPSLQNTVIVLDEVQGLPVELLSTCLAVLDQLVKDYGTTIILSSATMFDYSLLDITPVEALPKAKIDSYFAGTKRVKYDWRDHPMSWQDIADEIIQVRSPSVLIVANTVAGCDDAYQTMKNVLELGYQIYTYTASMPPAHRSAVLTDIKTAVENSKTGGTAVIICATSAIETGVDLDCSRGYRELAGLEAIVQFAGRINRNMSDALSPIIIFTTEHSYSQPPGSDRRAIRTLQAMAMGTDLQSPDVMDCYSSLLMQDIKASKSSYLENLRQLKWESVSREWQMIAPTVSVLVNPRLWRAENDIVAKYDQAIINKNYKLLQCHCVGLNSVKYNEAKKRGCILSSSIKGLEEWVSGYEMGISASGSLVF
jgi:CRISPR-associated endonuclease/helicase Cas3